jgi:hypothetical protein
MDETHSRRPSIPYCEHHLLFLFIQTFNDQIHMKNVKQGSLGHKSEIMSHYYIIKHRSFTSVKY